MITAGAHTHAGGLLIAGGGTAGALPFCGSVLSGRRRMTSQACVHAPWIWKWQSIIIAGVDTEGGEGKLRFNNTTHGSWKWK